MAGIYILWTSLNTKNNIDAPELRNAERTDGIITGLSFEMIEERLKTNLETLSAQILTLIQLLKPLYQDNSAKNTSTVRPGTHRSQTDPSLNREAGTFRTLPRTVIEGTGFSLVTRD